MFKYNENKPNGSENERNPECSSHVHEGVCLEPLPNGRKEDGDSIQSVGRSAAVRRIARIAGGARGGAAFGMLIVRNGRVDERAVRRHNVRIFAGLQAIPIDQSIHSFALHSPQEAEGVAPASR